MLLGPRDFFLSKEAIIYKQVCYQVPGISISSCLKRQLYINRFAIRSQDFFLSKEAIIYKQVCYQVPGISCPNKETIIYKQVLLGPRESKEAIIYKQVCYQVPGISSCPKRQLYINRYAIRSQGFLLVLRDNYI